MRHPLRHRARAAATPPPHSKQPPAHRGLPPAVLPVIARARALACTSATHLVDRHNVHLADLGDVIHQLVEVEDTCSACRHVSAPWGAAPRACGTHRPRPCTLPAPRWRTRAATAGGWQGCSSAPVCRRSKSLKSLCTHSHAFSMPTSILCPPGLPSSLCAPAFSPNQRFERTQESTPLQSHTVRPESKKNSLLTLDRKTKIYPRPAQPAGQRPLGARGPAPRGALECARQPS